MAMRGAFSNSVKDFRVGGLLGDITDHCSISIEIGAGMRRRGQGLCSDSDLQLVEKFQFIWTGDSRTKVYAS